jgi:hypothetical protein
LISESKLWVIFASLRSISPWNESLRFSYDK